MISPRARWNTGLSTKSWSGWLPPPPQKKKKSCTWRFESWPFVRAKRRANLGNFSSSQPLVENLACQLFKGNLSRWNLLVWTALYNWQNRVVWQKIPGPPGPDGDTGVLGDKVGRRCMLPWFEFVAQAHFVPPPKNPSFKFIVYCFESLPDHIMCSLILSTLWWQNPIFLSWPHRVWILIIN